MDEERRGAIFKRCFCFSLCDHEKRHLTHCRRLSEGRSLEIWRALGQDRCMYGLGRGIPIDVNGRSGKASEILLFVGHPKANSRSFEAQMPLVMSGGGSCSSTAFPLAASKSASGQGRQGCTVSICNEETNEHNYGGWKLMQSVSLKL